MVHWWCCGAIVICGSYVVTRGRGVGLLPPGLWAVIAFMVCLDRWLLLRPLCFHASYFQEECCQWMRQFLLSFYFLCFGLPWSVSSRWLDTLVWVAISHVLGVLVWDCVAGRGLSLLACSGVRSCYYDRGAGAYLALALLDLCTHFGLLSRRLSISWLFGVGRFLFWARFVLIDCVPSGRLCVRSLLSGSLPFLAGALAHWPFHLRVRWLTWTWALAMTNRLVLHWRSGACPLSFARGTLSYIRSRLPPIDTVAAFPPSCSSSGLHMMLFRVHSRLSSFLWGRGRWTAVSEEEFFPRFLLTAVPVLCSLNGDLRAAWQSPFWRLPLFALSRWGCAEPCVPTPSVSTFAVYFFYCDPCINFASPFFAPLHMGCLTCLTHNYFWRRVRGTWFWHCHHFDSHLSRAFRVDAPHRDDSALSRWPDHFRILRFV